MWVFGYGSLIWKVDFPVEEAVPGYIKGYVRRFWQASRDHRGDFNFPGRVVTLLTLEEWSKSNDDLPPDGNEGRIYGMCYKVPEADIVRVKEHLDYREKDGYTLHKVDVFPYSDSDEAKEPIVHKADVFIGTVENEAYVGYEPITSLADRISKARGESGPNYDYLLNLSKAIQHKFPHHPLDPHLNQLTKAVVSLGNKAGTNLVDKDSSEDDVEGALNHVPN